MSRSGSIPGRIAVRFYPWALRWRAEDLAGTVKGKVLSRQAQDNSFVIEVPVGTEEEAIKRLSASKYVISAQRIVTDEGS